LEGEVLAEAAFFWRDERHILGLLPARDESPIVAWLNRVPKSPLQRQ